MTYQIFQNNEDISKKESLLLNSTHSHAIVTNPNGLTSIKISTPLPRNKKGLPKWLGESRGVLLGVGVGLGLALCVTQIGSELTPSVAVVPMAETRVASGSVTVVPLQSVPISQTLTTYGTIEAFDLLSISPRATGLQIKSVNVHSGDLVAAGQVLAVLDDTLLRSQIDQAEAQVNIADALVTQAKSQLTQNEAALATAQENFQRYNTLFEQGAVSAADLSSRRTTVIIEQQSVASAIAAIESAQATVRSREAEVSRLSSQLDHTLVTAPASGIITEKTATVGDIASAGNALFKIVRDNQLELAVKVPQAQLAQINLGNPVQIRSSSDPTLQLSGRVRTINPTIDPTTRQATVNIELLGSVGEAMPVENRLRSGMFLQAEIVTDSREGVVVPAEAVLPQPDGSFVVYTLNADNTVNAKTVEIGDRIASTNASHANIEIRSGLDIDVPVVLAGASYLKDGDTVTVVDDTAL